MGCTWIHFRGIERQTKFPWQVASIAATANLAMDVHEHVQNDFGICLRLTSGERYSEDHIGEKIYRTPFPHVFLKYPGVKMKTGFESSREVFEIKYSAKVMNELSEILHFPATPEDPLWEIHLTVKESAIISELQQLMLVSHNFGVVDRIDMLSFELFEMLLMAKRQNSSRAFSPHSKSVMSIASYIQLHYREKIDWEKILPRYGMSRSTFLRYWKMHFGVSPAHYVRELKLAEACRLLQEERQRSIYDIAEYLGFCEMNYFCAVFRSKFGISPLQYRKKA